jgi:hypothetical protein
VPLQDRGTSGHAEFDGRHCVIGAWEMFDGDVGVRWRRQGWFRCEDGPFLAATKGSRVILNLVPVSGEGFQVDVEITVTLRSRNLWQFKTVA